MNYRYLYFFSNIQLSLITIHSTASVFSDEKGMKSLKGNIVCVEFNKNGTIEPEENFAECDGLLVSGGIDKKIYALTRKENDIKRLIEGPKSRTGYHPPLKVRDNVEGNQRAWILHATETNPDESAIVKGQTVTGTVVCLIPDYYRGNGKPIVSVVPCNEYDPNMHLIYNSAGQIYAIFGTEDRVAELEKSSNRKNVTLKGAIMGDKKGWILVLN